MNEPERKILYLALVFFALGLLSRYLPWGVPAISQNDVYSDLEYRTEWSPGPGGNFPVPSGITDKVTGFEILVEKAKQPKNGKKKAKKPKFPVYINRASAEDLCALKGVGPKLAEKIVGARTRNGPFSGPGDLEKVPGIGKKKLESILQGVNFD